MRVRATEQNEPARFGGTWLKVAKYSVALIANTYNYDIFAASRFLTIISVCY